MWLKRWSKIFHWLPQLLPPPGDQSHVGLQGLHRTEGELSLCLLPAPPARSQYSFLIHSVEEERLKTKLDVSKGVYITLKQQYETAKIEEVNEKSFIELIDGPTIALYRSSPKRKIFVLYWTSLIILISSFAFVIKDSRKLLNERDLEELNELNSIVKNQF